MYGAESFGRRKKAKVSYAVSWPHSREILLKDTLIKPAPIRVSSNILQEPGGGHGMDSFPDGKTLCAGMNHIDAIQFQIIERRPH